MTDQFLEGNVNNLLVNGSFEGPTAWENFFGGQTIGFSTAHAHTGTRSGLVTCTGSTAIAARRTYADPDPVEYTLSAWMYAPPSNSVTPNLHVQMIFWDYVGAPTYADATDTVATGTWTLITVVGTCPPGQTVIMCGIGIDNTQSGDKVYIDDAVLSVAVSTATGTLTVDVPLAGASYGISTAIGRLPNLNLVGAADGSSIARVNDRHVVGGYPLPDNPAVVTRAGIRRLRLLTGAAAGTATARINELYVVGGYPQPANQPVIAAAGVVRVRAIAATAAGASTATGTVTSSGAAASTVTIGQAVETDTALTLTRTRAYRLGQASETDTANPIAAHSVHVTAIGQAVETDTASTLTHSRVRRLGQASEVCTAGSARVTKTRTVGYVTEVDTAGPVMIFRARTIGQAIEYNAALAFRRSRSLGIHQATETSTALAMTPVSAIVRRPHTGTVTRPGSAILVQRPNIGLVVRP